MRRLAAVLAAGVVLMGCTGSSPTDAGRAAFLSDTERARLHLPAVRELTRAKADDVAHVAAVPQEARDAVAKFLKPCSVEWQTTAARSVGEYWLLWISFPKIADGGVDLIYSVEKKTIVGEFLGGYRG
jgi:hypothetical protein